MDSKSRSYKLAINGGTPVRSKPMPARRAFGVNEYARMQNTIDYYSRREEDPGYQGKYEETYCLDFCLYMGGGYADAVCSGTAALYIAIGALELPKGSEVIVSPITDPGTLSAIILNGLVPRLADSEPNSYNMGAMQFEERIQRQVSAVCVVHATGKPADIKNIVRIADQYDIPVIEDCSQAHLAMVEGQFVGTFGKIAAFSTMYRKAHITGSCGGVVYTRDHALHRRALALADRGKPRWIDGADDRNPNQFLFPALNLHSNELACAIGIASLARLRDTITRRLDFVFDLTRRMKNERTRFTLPPFSSCDSPFILPIFVRQTQGDPSKLTVALALQAEGIPLNPHYQYLVCEWPWIRSYLSDAFFTQKASSARNRSFCLYLNENYGKREAEDVAKALVKVDRAFKKGA